jgi:L-lactate dehydrogenase (cytochrome)
MSTTMLGTKCSIPFYVTATALGKLGHPEGEVVLSTSTRIRGLNQILWKAAWFSRIVCV